jgi:hypothetical protein
VANAFFFCESALQASNERPYVGVSLVQKEELLIYEKWKDKKGNEWCPIDDKKEHGWIANDHTLLCPSL